MRKLLCVFFAVFLLLRAACCPSASAAVNYCTQFEEAINTLRWYAPFWDIAQGEAFPVSSIINYTRQKLSLDAYGEAPITEGGTTYYTRYAIPADVFEAAAQDFFDIVDFDALRSYTSFFWDETTFTGIDNFQHYRQDRDVYLFSNSGTVSASSRYQVVGYTMEKGRYRVYARFLSLLWEQPEGVEGVDYVRIDNNYYAVEHYLEALLDISNGRVQFCSWDESGAIPDTSLTGPLTILAQSEWVTISGAEGVFPADTLFEITMADETATQDMADAIGKDVAELLAYQISTSAQPDGTMQLSFQIPEGFDADRLALYYWDGDGDVQRLHAMIDRDRNLIHAEQTQFGLYAVVELAEANPQTGDVNNDSNINARDVRLVMQYITGLIEEDDLSLIAADFNADGKINARDARLLLQQIAGKTQ